jgi:hypothetical protein
MPSKKKDPAKSVLVDTSFLIVWANPEAEHHEVAKKYYKMFLSQGYTLCLSTIVIAEFHQKQSIVDVLSTENFQIVPYNIDTAIATADMHHKLGSGARVGGQAEFKDDVKLIAQAELSKIGFIITNDASTLHKYCEKLRNAGLLKTQSICLSDGFDSAWFTGGQKSLLD